MADPTKPIFYFEHAVCLDPISLRRERAVLVAWTQWQRSCLWSPTQARKIS